MNNRILIISCYYGQLPEMFHLWADSCAYNPEFDFLLVTDQNVISTWDNVKILKLTFEELNNRIKETVFRDAKAVKPYKLCDFKPAYGLIFQEMLSGYTFWGHCDIDLIFGRLSDFINDKILDKNDKISYLGHLSLYRNCPQINQFCIMDDKLIDWHTVLSDDINHGVDEDTGIYQAFISLNIPVYDERIFFDIYPYKSHMELDNVINKRMNKKNDSNYRKQYFFWFEGRVWRCFYDKKDFVYEEAAYIHFGKSQIKSCHNLHSYNTMFFTKHSIICDKYDSLEQFKGLQLIDKYNPDSLLISIYDYFSLILHKVENRIRKLVR